MSDWKIKMDPNGDFDVVITDELKELDNADLAATKMDYESGKQPSEPPYSCRLGIHDWKWYEGLMPMERYWFCTVCDKKDKERKAPTPKRIR